MVRIVSEQLRSRGHGVQFLHPGDSNRLRRKTARNGFPAWELNLRGTTSAAHPVRSRVAFATFLGPTILQLLRLLRRERIDVVNVHFPVDSFVTLALCRLLAPIRLVTSIHGGDLILDTGEPRTLSWGARRMLQSADAIVAPSLGFRDEVLRSWRDLRGRTEVIHNSLDPLAPPKPEHTRVRAKKIPYLLTVAAHNMRKGLDVLLAAFDRIAGQYPNLELHLVGDGPLRESLEQQADASPNRARIRFLGARSGYEVLTRMRHCEVFVLGSRSESFGLAALEALACGRPVVASRVGGLPEVVQDGVTGLLVPPDDSDAVANAVVRLLDDAPFARSLGEAGARRVRDMFGSERAGGEYEALFTRLLERPQAS